MNDDNLTFPVDLTEDEVVSLQMLLEKRLGRLRVQKLMGILMGVYAVLILLFTGIQWWKEGQPDWLFIGGLLLLIGAFGGLLWYVPYTIRKQAKKAYRQRNFSGYRGWVPAG